MSRLKIFFDWLVDHPRYAGMVVGVGLGSAFVWPLATPLAMVCLFLAVYLIERVPLTVLPTVLMLVFGIKSLIALSWFWSAYPISWLFELAPSTQYIAIFFYWTSSALWLSSAGLILALLWRFSPLRYRRYLLPAVWVLAEYLGAVVFSILTAGPGSYITGAFSFGHIGYLFPYLTPIAVWGGVYVVGLIGLILVVIIYDYFITKHLLRFGVMLSMLLIIMVGSVLYQVPATPLPNVVAINTTFPAATDQETRQAALDEMMKVAVSLQPEYIILPEDSRYLYTYKSDQLGAAVAVEAWQILHATNTAMVIDSGRTTDELTGKIVARAFLWGTSSSLYTADKQYLVPQGEYMPSLYAFVLRFVGLGVVADALAETINYTSSRRVVAEDAAPHIPNLLFCFESVSPLAAKTLVANRPSDFIVHPMSHSWFNEPRVVWRQLETMLRYQAVFARTPIVSVGNEIKGQVYESNGEIIPYHTLATFPFGTIDSTTAPQVAN